MKHNTRFNPTACGDLHMGHLYMALVNATEAKRTGGLFSVRIDDTQKYWVHRLGRKLTDQYTDNFREQLSRFMVIDDWRVQSTMPSMREIRGEHELFTKFPEQRWVYAKEVDIISDPTMAVYPYTPYFTLEKVVWDFHMGVTHLIRGEDIITESSLYNYFVDVLGFPSVWQVYLPRLRATNREEIGKDDVEWARTISKTFRTYRLKPQIDKLGVRGVMDNLKLSCLVDPSGEFIVENIKWNPTVVGFTE